MKRTSRILVCFMVTVMLFAFGFILANATDDCTANSDWSYDYPYGQPEENIEEIEVYSYRDTETKTEVSSNANLTLDGWTLVSRDDGVWGAYGATSAWTKTKPVESEALKIVNTKTVTDKAAYTNYRYWIYRSNDHKTYGTKGFNGVCYNYFEINIDHKLSLVDSGNKLYGHYGSGCHSWCTKWFFGESKSVPAVTHQEYQYQQRVKNYTYTFSKVGEWSEYSLVKPDDVAGREIETKKMYRYSYAAHTYNDYYTTDKEATCTEDGITSIHCSKCNATKNITVIKALGHDFYDDYTVDIEVTCTKNGEKSIHCSRCDERKDITVLKKTGHVYKTKVTAATTKKDGKKVYTCEFCEKVVEKKISKIASVTLSATSYTYNNKAKKPSVVVTDSNGKKLKKDTDYTVKYASGRKNIGTYSVKVTFKGNYSGSKTVKFTIKLGTVKNLMQDTKKKGIAFKWDKVTGATGYEVYCYDSKSGKYKLLVRIKENGVKNSSAKGSMKMKVRAYRKEGSTTHYGAFSGAKTFKSR